VKKISKNEITAVILAGGQASRMDGEDKGLIVFRELPLIAHVVNITKLKVSRILISANRNFEEYANFGKVISDDLEGYQGPLAGISKALKVCSTPYLLVLPCDSNRFSDREDGGIESRYLCCPRWFDNACNICADAN